MPTHWLPEILDPIVDFLYDEPETLRLCCLVSKSWVPRARKHLFATVRFRKPDDIEMWKRTFPDQSSTPARHTHTLSILCPEVVTPADAAEGGWILTFSRVARLELDNQLTYMELHTEVSLADGLGTSLVPFQKLSPTLKSLYMCSLLISRSYAFALIHSLPLLKNLALLGDFTDEPDEPAIMDPPSTSPAITGTLQLGLFQGIEDTAHRLLRMPNGLHPKKLKLTWRKGEDLRATAELVRVCFDTLTNLNIACELEGEFIPFLCWGEPNP
jgi:hypothetical protein